MTTTTTITTTTITTTTTTTITTTTTTTKTTYLTSIKKYSRSDAISNDLAWRPERVLEPDI